MLEGFRSLLLNLPENPNTVKPALVSCPSYFLVLTDFFRLGIYLAPPSQFVHAVFWDLDTFSYFVYPQIHLTLCQCFQETETLFLRLGMWTWSKQFVWGGSIHHSCSVKVCIDLFFLYTLLESFSAGFMYWLLCNSWTKHRVELIFKEKRLYSICFVTSFCK